ncbi:hypothetical protein PV328_009510 [Microctonus aethiopoides]|uniref:AN1-type domain-containing protein n=1 Tax=Microctonus aethiopoides TaxID=144406 RepID=A0AA39C5Y1_9HYME|nr:hypothetical protein PV328_009510 [Microctonus aethiopoides]
MEFPTIGLRCAVESCKQNDFLPTNCIYCSETFCKSHFHILSHNCTKINDNIVVEPGNSTEYFICSRELCSDHSPIEIPCPKCKKHYCLAHRHHGCLEPSEEEIMKKLTEWEKPKEVFAIAKNSVDSMITENLRKSKKVNVANKVQLMRLKGRAIGCKGIPTENRRYFLIYPPLSSPKKESRAIYVCQQWTVGKAIDSIAEILGIRNSNNMANAEKLRIFHHYNGNILVDKVDIVLSDLFNNNTLIDGQNLILEYSNADKIDSSLYK